MPSFLNPIVLIGLIATTVPLLIHLFTRRRLRKVDFSSLWFLKNLEKTRIRQVKLKNLLLLIIRTLIVILIVLAFARPALKGELAGLGRAAASSVVLLMDDSYSMARQTSQGTLFEIAQKKAGEVLDNLSSQDEAAIIYLSPPPDSALFSRDFWSMKDTLLNRRPSYAVSNFSKAIEQALKLLLGSSNLNRELYVFTDKQGSGWEKLKQLTRRITSYWFKLSEEETQNLSVSEIDFGRQLIELGRSFNLQTEINNHTAKAVSDHLIGFYLDDKKQAQSEVKISAGSKTIAQFGAAVHQTGFHSGYFESGEDDLLADNYRYFAFKIPERIKVLLAGENESDNRLIQYALRPEEKLNLNLQVKSIGASNLAFEDFNNYDVVILNDLKTISAATLNNLQRFLETGGGVWVILGRNADLSFYNANITRRFFGIELKLSDAKNSNASGFYSLEKWDLRHPVFSIYQTVAEKERPEIKFYQIHSGQSKKEAKVLAYFSGNQPALIEEQIEKGKALLFLSGLDRAASDISQHPFFVPFVNRMVGYLAQDVADMNQSYTVGEAVQRKLLEVPTGQPIELIYPNQSKETLTPIFAKTSALIKIQNTALPGIYQIKTGEKLLDEFAVNIDARESQPEKIDLEKIKKQVEGNQYVKIVEVPAKAEVVKFIQRTRYGRELWRETLILALVLLGVEMWLGRTASKLTQAA